MLVLNTRLGNKIRLKCNGHEAELILVYVSSEKTATIKLALGYFDVGGMHELELGPPPLDEFAIVELGGVCCRIKIGEWVSRYHVKLCFDAPKHFHILRVVDGKPVEKKTASPLN